MQSTARRRIMRDLHVLYKSNSDSLFATPLENDILTWVSIIYGPKNTDYENGTFCLILQFSENYPQTPPSVRFISTMFHPNIYTDGRLCLDILNNKWTPTYDAFSILMCIQSLLSDPNSNSPANVEAADIFEQNIELYKKRVKDTVISSWKDFEELKTPINNNNE